MDKELIVNDRIRIPTSEFRITFARSSGPGGQNVNKVNSKATLHWLIDNSAVPDEIKVRLKRLAGRRLNDAGELVLQSDRYRDQPRNIQDCLDRVRRLVLAASEKPKRRKRTRVPRRAIESRLKAKKQKSERKQSRQQVKFD